VGKCGLAPGGGGAGGGVKGRVLSRFRDAALLLRADGFEGESEPSAFSGEKLTFGGGDVGRCGLAPGGGGGGTKGGCAL
jgi:hypothetical protein